MDALSVCRAGRYQGHESASVSMTTAEKYRVLAWVWAGSISTKLSIALVLGLALLPLARLGAPAATGATAQRLPDPKVDPAGGPQGNSGGAGQALVTGGLKIDPAPLTAAGELARNDRDEALLQLAAAKRRAKKSRDDEEFEPKRTASTIAAETPQRKSSAIAFDPSAKAVETEEAEAPKPDIWSDAEVITALKECVRVLGPIAADIEVAPPVKKEECGAPAPVMLRRIGSGPNKVEINPPAMLNCAMVAGLHAWVEKTLQPTALELYGSPIAKLRNASGYSCRNRNGSAFNSDKLSEHAKANAVDIAGFVTADGRSIEVVRAWGPTARDIREAERLAAVRAKEAKDAAKESSKAKEVKAEPAKAEPRRTSSAIATRQEGPPNKDRRKAVVTSELQKGNSVTDAKAVPVLSSGQQSDVKPSTSPEATFLRRLHKGACGVFGTVLGPEANEAHRDHFHFDLASRRRNSYCE
jgi:hypothetical protein